VQSAQRLADQGLTEKKVSRLLIEARLRLEPYLPGIWADETGRGAP
jgi:hypothetical protein